MLVNIISELLKQALLMKSRNIIQSTLINSSSGQALSLLPNNYELKSSQITRVLYNY